MRKSILLLVAILLLTLPFLSGCGKKSASTSNTAAISTGASSTANYDMAKGTGDGNFGNQTPSASQTTAAPELKSTGQSTINVGSLTDGGHKVIFTGQVAIETLEFDNAVNQLIQYVNIAGGYAEMSNIQGGKSSYSGDKVKRTANFTFRIPKTDFTKFMTEVKTCGNVISESTNGEDITDKYFDTEARVTTLKIQEERLLNLLKKAEKLEDIIKLEGELSNLRYQIESLTGTLKKWDNLVDYATVNVTVNEVEIIKPIVVKPKTLWDKISKGFTESVGALVDILEGLMIVIVVVSPFAVVIGIIAYILWRIYKWRNKRKGLTHSKETKGE